MKGPPSVETVEDQRRRKNALRRWLFGRLTPGLWYSPTAIDSTLAPQLRPLLEELASAGVLERKGTRAGHFHYRLRGE